MAMIDRRAQAKADLRAIATYLWREASPRVSTRFVAAVEESLAGLAKMPLKGSVWEYTEELEKVPMRFVPVKRFKNYLIFYYPRPGGVEIVRVLHGSQDLISILESDCRE